MSLTDRTEAEGDTADVNVLRARIEQCSYTGARFEYHLAIGDLRVRAESAVRHAGPEISLPAVPTGDVRSGSRRVSGVPVACPGRSRR
ncbi:hypothetical protein [Streptomyces sp. BRA346]|uniref:hypothetical protein n=1 Tax=Streptomyces sp. BRA346 TaxID=2878199 RepID=UPI0040635E71